MLNHFTDYREKTGPSRDQVDSLILELSRAIDLYLAKAPVKDAVAIRVKLAVDSYVAYHELTGVR